LAFWRGQPRWLPGQAKAENAFAIGSEFAGGVGPAVSAEKSPPAFQRRSSMNITPRIVFSALCFLGVVSLALPTAAAAQQSTAAPPAAGAARATPLLSKDLPDIAGKEVTMSVIEYAPGGTSASHRHDAHTFVYVLEGSVVMQVTGGEPVTLVPGQTFYETPADVHAVSKNASATAPAKFLVFMIKDKGKPATRPAN
jgi:quercetin dioxygenase-like cupin family protein